VGHASSRNNEDVITQDHCLGTQLETVLLFRYGENIHCLYFVLFFSFPTLIERVFDVKNVKHLAYRMINDIQNRLWRVIEGWNMEENDLAQIGPSSPDIPCGEGSLLREG